MGSRQTVIPPPPPGFTEVIGGGPLPPPPPGFTEDLTPRPGIIESFVDRGIESVKGAGNLALDAAKSATSLEGQATFLPRLAKGLYEGAVDAGAGAIARQFPKGVDNLPESELLVGAARGGAAAVPVIGPYVMNKVSDIEEGNWRKVVGETLFDAVTAGAGKAAPKAASPALAKMRSMGGELAADARDIARSRIWGPAAAGAIGTAIGGPVGGAIGLGADLIYSTRYARNKRLNKAAAAATDAADARIAEVAKREADLQKIRDKAAMDQLKLDRARTQAEIARETAIEKARESATIASGKVEARTLDAVDKGRAQSAKLADAESMASGSIEARILEMSQKAEAAAQQELAVAQQRVQAATDRTRAKAESDFAVAQKKADAAAARTKAAAERAEAAQIKREFRQRTQLDKQAAKAAEKAAPESATPATQAPPPSTTVPTTLEMLQQEILSRTTPTTTPTTPTFTNLSGTPPRSGKSLIERMTSVSTTLARKGYSATEIETQLLKQFQKETPDPKLAKTLAGASNSPTMAGKATAETPLVKVEEVAHGLARDGGSLIKIANYLITREGFTHVQAAKAARDAIRGLKKQTKAQKFEAEQVDSIPKKFQLSDVKPYEP